MRDLWIWRTFANYSYWSKLGKYYVEDWKYRVGFGGRLHLNKYEILNKHKNVLELVSFIYITNNSSEYSTIQFGIVHLQYYNSKVAYSFEIQRSILFRKPFWTLISSATIVSGKRFCSCTLREISRNLNLKVSLFNQVK